MDRDTTSVMLRVIDRLSRRWQTVRDDVVRGRFWQFKVVFITWLLSFVINTPKVNYHLDPSQGAWPAVMAKAADLFYDPAEAYPLESNSAKYLWRLTVPFVAGVLGMTPHSILAAQWVCGLLVFFLSATLAYRITQDRELALLVTLGIGFTYSGLISFGAWNGQFDGIGVMLGLLMCVLRNPLLIGTATFGLTWLDERGFLGAAAVMFYYVATHAVQDGQLRLSPRILRDVRLWAVIIGCALHLVARFLIAQSYHLPLIRSDGATLELIVFQSSLVLFLGIVAMFEGGWIILLGAIATLIYLRRWLLLLGLAGILFVTIILSMYVYDISRTTVYILPVAFATLLLLQQTESSEMLKNMARLAAVVSAILPTIQLQAGVTVHDPLVMYLINYVLDFLVRRGTS